MSGVSRAGSFREAETSTATFPDPYPRDPAQAPMKPWESRLGITSRGERIRVMIVVVNVGMASMVCNAMFHGEQEMLISIAKSVLCELLDQVLRRA
jgi:hypothetical protein